MPAEALAPRPATPAELEASAAPAARSNRPAEADERFPADPFPNYNAAPPAGGNMDDLPF